MRYFGIRIVSLFGVGWVALSGAGCSDFRAPTTAGEVITHPLGTQAPFQRGSSKSEVLAAWGNPDQVVPQGVDELGTRREEWVYRGRLPAIPIDSSSLTHSGTHRPCGLSPMLCRVVSWQPLPSITKASFSSTRWANRCRADLARSQTPR